MSGTSRLFEGRITTVLAVGGLLVAASVAIALVPTFGTGTLAGKPDIAVGVADLAVDGVDMDTTAELTRESRRPGDKKVDVEAVDAAAATIQLQNRGAKIARITKLSVHVSTVWAPAACGGPDQTSTSVGYDFVLPGDVGEQSLPMTLSRAVDREVAGGATDTMIVTIGERELGGTGWAWATSANAELELDDGSSVTTGEFVLMNSTEIERTVALAKAEAANPAQARQSGHLRCIQNNVALLEEAADAPGVRSPSIKTLLDRLAQLGFTSRGLSGDGADPAPPAEHAPPRDTWVAMLGSLPDSISPAQLRAATDNLSSRLGVRVGSARSGALASLAPGYYVLFHDGGFRDGHDALQFCRDRGISSDKECAGRYLSDSRDDYGLNCHFTDPAGSARCTRS